MNVQSFKLVVAENESDEKFSSFNGESTQQIYSRVGWFIKIIDDVTRQKTDSARMKAKLNTLILSIL